MKKINTQKGFTLIELMVVVSIISLLASVVVVALADSREGAKNTKRNELARQYVTGLGLYFGEYGHYPEQVPGDPQNANRVCLGSYPNGCFVEGSYTSNTAVNTAISEFVPGTPASLEATNVTANNQTYTFQGITYRCTDSSCSNYEIAWFVKGSGNDAECFGGAEKIEFEDTDLGYCVYSS